MHGDRLRKRVSDLDRRYRASAVNDRQLPEAQPAVRGLHSLSSRRVVGCVGCVAFAALLMAVFASGAGALGHSSPSGFFRSPSVNTHCDHAYGLDGVTKMYFVRCGIKSGIKPLPPRERPDCSRYHWVSITSTGRSSWDGAECPGKDSPDAGPFGGPGPVLAYGRTWRGDGMSCKSTVAGLTCRNRSGHGFFLSRAHTYLF